jgi:putative hydrolase of the HAD superfamily
MTAAILHHAVCLDRGSSNLAGVKRAVIFDGDDTLWLTEDLYDRARSNARRLVEAAGMDGSRWEELEREIDVGNVAGMGHSPERFPTSCTQALDRLAAQAGLTVDESLRAEVRAAAQAVFTADAPLRPHAEKVVRELANRGVRLALLTKGDRAVQEARIARSGLAGFFDVIEIVEHKSEADIGRVLHSLGVEADEAVSVGNSIRSDVLPSIAAGVDAVWIPAHVWEYERAHDHLAPEGVAAIADLGELLDVLDGLEL